MTQEQELITERHGHVLVIRINRPQQRNAFNGAVMTGIGHALLAAEADPDVRAVVLTGTGDKAFSAGMDLKEFAAGGRQIDPADQPAIDAFHGFTSGTGGTTKPVIAAVQATALAGGLELALACDLAIVAEDARLGLPEVKRGLFAAGGGMYLARRIPLAKALELTLTGDPVTAQQAASIGLVNAVAPAGQVLQQAIDLANRISENGPLAVAASKKLVRAAAFEPLEQVRKVHEQAQGAVFSSQDAKEGATAFAQRRSPSWTGK